MIYAANMVVEILIISLLLLVCVVLFGGKTHIFCNKKFITYDEALKKFEGDAIEVIPADKKRIVIPAFGFADAVMQKRYKSGVDGYVVENVKGLAFLNPKDAADGETKPNQVLKQKDGVLLCYDASGRREKIEQYLKKHRNTFDNAVQLKRFIDFLTRNVVNADGGKPDLWDADTSFAAGLIGAPAKDNIKSGHIFVGVKKKEAVQAVMVNEGEVFEGAEGHRQTAGKGGAYILKDSNGMRLIQADAFAEAYRIVKIPKTTMRKKAHELYFGNDENYIPEN